MGRGGNVVDRGGEDVPRGRSLETSQRGIACVVAGGRNR